MISRKKFLRLAGLGIVASLTPSLIFSQTFQELPLTDDVKTLLKKARRLRKQGKLNQAKNKYQEVLSIDPTEIRAYNGIRKIFLAKKKQEYQVIQLYQQAVDNIPNNLRIKKRLYNQYIKVALGNKKVASQLNIPGRILVYVKEQYEALLLQNYPGKKNLRKELEKVNKYIALNVDITDSRKNTELKKYRKENRKTHKNRFNHLTAQETTQALSVLKSKAVSADRIPQIREMSRINVMAFRKEKNYAEALNASLVYLNTINKSDPYFIKQFRELSKQLRSYDNLISFEQYNHSKKKNFWSALALFDAYFRKSENENVSGNSMMDSLIQELNIKSRTPQQIFEVITRQIKYNILKDNFGQAKTQILELCKQRMGISDAHTVDRLNLIIAKYYAKQNDSENKNQILKIINNPKGFLENQDELTRHIALINMNRSAKKFIHLQQLQQNINNL